MVSTTLRQPAQNTAIGPIEKCLSTYEDKKRECPVDIAAPATMGVVSIRRFRRRRPLRAKKMKPQSRFKTLASILQGLFISGLTRRDMFGGIRRSEKRSKAYFISGCRRKRFPNSNPKAESLPRILLFFRSFPSFPGILHSQTRPSRRRAGISAVFRKRNKKACNGKNFFA